MIIFLPILWMACVSLKTDEASMPSAFQYFVPPFTVRNYTDVLTGRPQVVRWVLNSFGVAAIVTVLTTLLCAMASYAMAKLKFRYSKAMYIYFLIGLMVPGEATIVSLFVLANKLGMIDTYWGLILPSLAGSNEHHHHDELPARHSERPDRGGAHRRRGRIGRRS